MILITWEWQRCVYLVASSYEFGYFNESLSGRISLLAAHPLVFLSCLSPLPPVQTALQDTYITIHNADGEKWMKKLRDQIEAHKQSNGGSNGYQSTEITALLV